jgi:chitinase
MQMEKFFSTLMIGIAISACSSTEKTIDSSLKPVTRAVIAYVFPGNLVLESDEIAAGKLTHVNYAFANIQDGEMVEGYEADSANFVVLNRLKKDNPSLKILVSVGGWGWSGGFSDMALTKESRTRFIQSALAFIERHRLDGLDIDWEYPGLPGAGNTHRPEDKENFTLLLKECRSALDAADESKHYLLTIAAAASSDFLEKTNMQEASQYLDMVNLMTYDFAGEWDDAVRHHANLYPSEYYELGNSVSETVSRFIKVGVPAEKMVVGVPFYGRGWRNCATVNDGIGQSGDGLSNVNLSYRNLKTNYLSDSAYKQGWDDSAKAPYLFNEDERIFITYENPRSLHLKCGFVKDNNLKGVMFWEYFGDYDEELLSAISGEMIR